VISLVSLGVGLWGQATGRPWQSMLFLALGATQLGVALGARARPGTWLNPFLLVAVVVAFALQVSAVYLAPLQQLLGTVAVSAPEVGAIAMASAVGYLAARIDRHRNGAPRSG
jgi:Ca2+-transporting ATPase